MMRYDDGSEDYCRDPRRVGIAFAWTEQTDDRLSAVKHYTTFAILLSQFSALQMLLFGEAQKCYPLDQCEALISEVMPPDR